jgi:hypothetical protein
MHPMASGFLNRPSKIPEQGLIAIPGGVFKRSGILLQESFQNNFDFVK